MPGRIWKWGLGLILLLAGAAPAGAYDVPVANLLRNGAVENGDANGPTHWFRSASGASWSTEASASASHALKVTGLGGAGQADWRSRGFEVLARQRYILEWDWAWSGVTVPFQVEVRFFDGPVDGAGNPTGSQLEAVPFATPLGSQASFSHRMELVQAPWGAASADVRVLGGGQAPSNSFVLVDNLVLRGAVNLVPHGDVDYGTFQPAMWLNLGAGSWATNKSRSGTRSLKIEDNSNAAGGGWQSAAAPVAPNVPTFFSLAWQTEFLSLEPAQIRLRWWTAVNSSGFASGALLGEATWTTSLGTSFSFLEENHWVTPPEGAKFADVVIATTTAGMGSLYVDDVTLIQVEPAGPVSLASWLPSPKRPLRLFRVEGSSVNNSGLRLMIQSLQGLVAQNRPEIFIRFNGTEDLGELNRLSAAHGVPAVSVGDPWLLVHNYRDALLNRRYILCNPDTESQNVATSLAGRFGALIIDPSMEPLAQSLGLRRFMDVRTAPTQQEVVNQYAAELNARVALEQRYTLYHNRDYFIFFPSIVFHGGEGDNALRQSVMQKLEPGAWLLGWNGNEKTGVQKCSAANVNTVPADYTRNLSVSAGLADGSVELRQKRHGGLALEGDKHYVSFIISDGDNMNVSKYYYRHNARFWPHANRGKFSVGWEMAPSIAQLAPASLKWYYDEASNTAAARDYFVTGPSGSSYLYPGTLSKPELLARQTGELMGQADLRYMTVIEDDSRNSFSSSIMAPWLAQSPIHGVFYQAYSSYSKYKGELKWAYGKPILSAKYRLWGGITPKAGDPTTTATQVAALNNIAEHPARPDTEKGFSWVVVHIWSMGLHEVGQIVNGLDPRVKVVSPGELMDLLQRGLGAPWQFDLDKEGWQGTTAAGGSVAVESQALRLDGDDISGANTTANAYYEKYVTLPVRARTLRLKARARTSSSDANLRVQLLDVDGTLRDLTGWRLISNTSFEPVTADLTPYAGQRVALRVEVDDDEDDSTVGNSSLYVDDIEVLDDSLLHNGDLELNDGSGWAASWKSGGAGAAWSVEGAAASPIHHFKLSGASSFVQSKALPVSGLGKVRCMFNSQATGLSGGHKVALRLYEQVDVQGYGTGASTRVELDLGVGSQAEWAGKLLEATVPPTAKYADVLIEAAADAQGVLRVDDIKVYGGEDSAARPESWMRY